MARIPLSLTLFLFFLTHRTQAQTTIKGKLFSSDNQVALFATVALIKAADSSLVKGIYTDEQGLYAFENIKVGDYLVKAMAVGMGKTISERFSIIEGQKEFVVSDITFKQSSVTLEAVEVIAVKPLIEFKNGVTVLNVDNTALAAGNTAYDILKRAPGVTVDNNENISLQGKQGVKIMIDGRLQQLSPEQLASMLKSIGSEGIDKIEVMKNPSSKYDAEGTSGIIQIKTKKAKLLGFDGRVLVGVNKGELFGENAGAALNYKAEKYSLFSNVNVSNRDRLKTVSLNRKIGNGADQVIFDQLGKETRNNQNMDFKVGADWYVSNRTTIGLVVDGVGTLIYNATDSKTTIGGNNNLGFNHLNSSAQSPENWTNINYNLNGIHKLDSNGTQLEASFDFTNYHNKNDNAYTNRFYDVNNLEVNTNVMEPNIYNNNTLSDIVIFTGKVDFTNKWTKKLNMESGLKYSNVDTKNSLLFERKDNATATFYNDTKFSNQFQYTEFVSAGYVNLQREIPHGSIQIGLRGEHTNAKGNNITLDSTIKRDYFQLFPNISFDYGKSEKHKFQLSYSRRINRPDYFQLNPFTNYLDQYTSSEGNPFLSPEISHNASFTYILMQFLYHTISYQRTNNVIQQYTVQDDATRETKQVVRNITASNNYAYDVFAYFPIKKWWIAQLNVTGWYTDFEGNINGASFKKGRPAWQANFSNEIVLPKNYTFELSGNYQAPMLWGIYQLKSQSSVDIGIKKTFFGNKLSLKLAASDIFYMQKTRVNVQFDNQDFRFIEANDTRRVRFTLTYNFGNTKFKMRDSKGNEAEKNRLKKS